MTLDLAPNSYGSVDGVAGMCAIYTDVGQFNGNTHPTDEQVVVWLNQISGFMNVALNNEGFVIPVVQADAKLTMDAVVEQYVSDMVQASNSAGRFFTDRFLAAGLTPLMQIYKDVQAWVSDSAGGLENIGVVRQSSPADTIGTRGFDKGGNAITPIFQRRGFGNTFQDFDT